MGIWETDAVKNPEGIQASAITAAADSNGAWATQAMNCCYSKLRLFTVALLVAAAGCGDSDLRGSTEPSAAGGTYFILGDNDGGGCGPARVDGKIWPHALHEPGPIEPGKHRIAICSGSTFEVKAGTTYTFDYWGP